MSYADKSQEPYTNIYDVCVYVPTRSEDFVYFASARWKYETLRQRCIICYISYRGWFVLRFYYIFSETVVFFVYRFVNISACKRRCAADADVYCFEFMDFYQFPFYN